MQKLDAHHIVLIVCEDEKLRTRLHDIIKSIYKQWLIVDADFVVAADTAGWPFQVVIAVVQRTRLRSIPSFLLQYTAATRIVVAQHHDSKLEQELNTKGIIYLKQTAQIFDSLINILQPDTELLEGFHKSKSLRITTNSISVQEHRVLDLILRYSSAVTLKSAYASIGKHLDISPDSVRRTHERAKRKLKKQGIKGLR